MKKYLFGWKNIFLLIVAFLPFLWRLLEHVLSAMPQTSSLQNVLGVIEIICYFHIVPVLMIVKDVLICFLSKDVKHCATLIGLMFALFIISLFLFPPAVNVSVGKSGTIVVICFIQFVSLLLHVGAVLLKRYNQRKNGKNQT